ncbi:MAG: hypothetical protein B7Z73_11980 [Planctomycetia bacterium 21-64-5]|nr:MAG: hypothetical protein B7Z73_11980 [Planctomycetia bacterium 21-64-5]HQU45222.1 glycosyltransferase [Pirellulales bacterium]
MQQAPKVSVAMITFNHERFIVQAVESALAQQADFDFEIVVGEDASTDRTRELLTALAERHPGRIRLILHNTNVGMHRNLIAVLAACRGQYVALLEGDDYWTDPEKLRRQVEVFDRRPEVVICHHNAMAVYDDDRSPAFVWHTRSPARHTTLESLLDGNRIVTCTAVFRNGLLGELPEWYSAGHVGDWTLHVLNARHGRIAYIDRVMAVYRLHWGGIWSPRPRRRTIEGLIATAELMKGSLSERQRRRLTRTIARWHADLVQLLLSQGQWDEARQHGEGHLSRGSRLRLTHFYRGLECEQEGRRWSALRHLLLSAASGPNATRITLFDIALAVTRVACPPLYRAGRNVWRWRRGASPSSRAC